MLLLLALMRFFDPVSAHETPIADAVATQPSSHIVRQDRADEKWVKPRFLGLQVGSSTIDEAIAKLGKPIWQGAPEETVYPEHMGCELEMEFRDPDKMNANIVVLASKTTRKILAITVYPNSPESFEEVVMRFGTDYRRVSKTGSLCSATRHRKIPASDVGFLIYPKLGLYVALNENKRVGHIVYASACSRSW